jgi:phosphoglycolate phosphatase
LIAQGRRSTAWQTATMTPSLILFDLDGTLSDPQVGITRSINHALRTHGYAERSVAELLPCIGPPLDESFRELTGRQDEAHLHALVLSYRERYAEVGYAENVIYPGVASTLAALAGRGARLGLCTSKRVDFAEMILRLFGLREHFGLVNGGEIGVQKWQQMAALQAAGQLPPDTLMIGDRAVDMVAAHRNGLRSGAVMWGHGSRGELMAESPHWVFEQPADWLGLLD